MPHAKALGNNSCVMYMYMYLYKYIHVCTCVSWFLQCMGYVPREDCMYFRGWSPRKYIQHEGGTIPCTVKTMTCTDRPYKANRQISFGTRMSSAVQSKVQYTTRCSYSSIV